MKNGQGQGLATEQKIRDLSELFGMEFRIVASILKRYPRLPQRYVHVDLNSGCGYNYEAECDGSPIAFLKAANCFPELDIIPHFVELDEKRHEQLITGVVEYLVHCVVVGSFRNESGENFHTYREDNDGFLTYTFPALVERNQYGSILADPNGFDFPLAGLRIATEWAPLMDLFLNVPFNISKRVNATPNFEQRIRGMAALLKLKNDWIIRESTGQWQHSIWIGRNTDKIDEWRKRGFYKLSEPTGWAILEWCCLTAKERESNPEFYLRELRRILADAGISRPAPNGDGLAWQPLLPLRSGDDGSSPRSVSTLGPA